MTKPNYTAGPWYAGDYSITSDEIEIRTANGDYIFSIDVDGQYDLNAWPEILTGMSFPPNKTIDVKWEYETCPKCQPGPHGFYARRRMQMILGDDDE